MKTIIVAVLLMTNASIVEVESPSLTACLEKQAAVALGLDNILDGPDGDEIIQRVLECKIESVNTGEDIEA